MYIPSDVLVAFLVAASVICITPGPDMLYVISFGLAKGRGGGVAAAAGVALGMLFHTFLAAFGVSVVVARFPELLSVLKFIGVAYLVYMGIGLVRDRSNLSMSEEKPSWSVGKIAAKAALVNVANPKVFIFYIAFLPQFTSVEVGPVYLQMLLLGTVFVVMGFATDAVVGVLSGALGSRLVTRPQAVRKMNISCGVIMFSLALVILFGV